MAGCIAHARNGCISTSDLKFDVTIVFLDPTPTPTPKFRRFGHKYQSITGSTVVLTCCKGDGQSQWKTPIFGPSQLGNPLTDFDKI